jgi:gliding motility-associated-like protein
MLLPVMDKIEFFYPNVFSPNGNGINESFGLSANQWNKVKDYNLKIYNRWGEKMFDSDHMEEHWSGDKAQQSVYIYKATIRDVYNVLHEIEGVVEVLR